MTLDEITSHAELGGRFTVTESQTLGRVAWWLVGREEVADEDTEWTGWKVPTGMVILCMVGDDRPFVFDPADVERLHEDAYCHSCGQVGCTHGVAA